MKILKPYLRRMTIGYCTCCRKRTLFVANGYWYRDDYRCIRCKSIPRMRALRKVLDSYTQNRYNLKIHESSPNKNQILWMKEYKNYSYSYYYEKLPLGYQINNSSCTNQNLCDLTFEDNSFDIFITQDVLEHVVNPFEAFREIERVLKPGGVHIFTTPIYLFSKTKPRIKYDESGELTFIEEPIYHGNPISGSGSLVTYDWGDDIAEIIDNNTSFSTSIIRFGNSKLNYKLGLEADFLQVIVSRKKNN